MRGVTAVTDREYDELSEQYSPRKINFLLRDKRKDELLVYGWIFANGAEYREPVPKLDWTLLPETQALCDYPCRKAETDFRGRHWIVWYTEEIPSDEGPWKLGGLPGLILKATSADREQQFMVFMVRKGIGRIYRSRYLGFKTTRERFNKTTAAYKWNAGNYISGHQGVPKDMDGNELRSEQKRLFYNPLEKE